MRLAFLPYMPCTRCPIPCQQVLKNFFELWFWDSKPSLVRRLMRLLLTRHLMDSLHPCGQTYGEVGVACANTANVQYLCGCYHGAAKAGSCCMPCRMAWRALQGKGAQNEHGADTSPKATRKEWSRTSVRWCMSSHMLCVGTCKPCCGRTEIVLCCACLCAAPSCRCTTGCGWSTLTSCGR